MANTNPTAHRRPKLALSADHTPATEPDRAPRAAQYPFTVVGIGASAGGLAAFETFFTNLPTDRKLGMAFVLVQHLAPNHKSILSELIRRYTPLAVYEVEDGMKIEADCVYIIPPGHDMALLNGVLQLFEHSTPQGQRLPINFFFRSLALDQHERAISIILSGTGSDGSQSLSDIKHEGGMVMVQSPESTEYDDMPRSAIATGLVDFQLAPAEMPAQLISYVAHSSGNPTRKNALAAAHGNKALQKVFFLLRNHTGHDFSQYKPSTIHRRIERRLAVHQLQTIDNYIKYLQHSPAEIDALFSDLLIGVTSFFRDREAFAFLEEKVIPELFTAKPPGSLIRIWAPGCANGQEAYSLAIMLQEHLDLLMQNYRVQIFATDIDTAAIAVARSGVYPLSIATDISPARLSRFFAMTTNGSAYRICKTIREMLVFSEQNICKDPPFSKLDLICCRNLLIYMGGELQKRLIPLFHYALNPGGFLFLGTSESIGDFADLFTIIDRKSKVYQRREAVPGLRRTSLVCPTPAAPLVKENDLVTIPAIATGKLSLRELTEQALLRQVAPTGALVNSQGDIQYLHGRTGMYLEPASGDSGVNNILYMAREGLQAELALALKRAVSERQVIRRTGLLVKTNGDFTATNLTVCPLPPRPNPVSRHPASQTIASKEIEGPLYLVILEEGSLFDLEEAEKAADADRDKDDTAATGAGANALITALKQQLWAKDEFLQTANEELKSTNEEMQSVNEELQSTNEELETSKEELQAINEELATINAELQSKVSDLSRANNDMNNLLAGTGIATVFVDKQLRILRFTPTATPIVNLIDSDVHRPVGHIVSNLRSYNSLVADVQTVLDTLIPQQAEVQTIAGLWYTMRIVPYRTLEKIVEGAVITFVDISETRRVKEDLDKARQAGRLAVVVRDVRDAITVQDLQGRILAWNPGAVRIYGWTEAEALAMNAADMIPAGLRAEALAMIRQLSRAEILAPYRSQRIAKDGRIVEVSMTSSALLNTAGVMYAIATTERAREEAREDRLAERSS